MIICSLQKINESPPKIKNIKLYFSSLAFHWPKSKHSCEKCLSKLMKLLMTVETYIEFATFTDFPGSSIFHQLF